MDKNKEKPISWLSCFLIIVLYFIPYGIINHWPISREVIPFILGEDKIPFLPWTFIIYISIFFQAIIILRKIPKSLIKKTMSIAAWMVVLGLIILLLFPKEYPRELYTSDSMIIGIFRVTDGPGNCFPSLHVAVTIFLAFCYELLEKSPMRRTLIWLWTLAIIISVLTTKQHYLIDIVGGIIIALPAMYKLKNLSLLKK